MTSTMVQIAANVVIVGGGLAAIVRSMWRAVAALDRITDRLDDHERRLDTLETVGR